MSENEPDQGWKIHVSATLLSAVQVFETIAPILAQTSVAYKIAPSLEELIRINAGIFYGYSQIGKFITVYPSNLQKFERLAVALHYATKSFPAPTIPFDFRLTPDSCVHYRYGVFRVGDSVSYKSTKLTSLREPNGTLRPDDRLLPPEPPEWVPKPNLVCSKQDPPSVVNGPLCLRYSAFNAIVQRGKGGIYTAIDMQGPKPRIVILKEGRLHGETSWDGKDGRQRIENEKRVINELRLGDVDAPEVYDAFYSGSNFYLVMERVMGINFQTFLDRRQHRLSRKEMYFYGQQVPKILAKIHAAGWVWRDCKPANFMLTPTGLLRPLDFEGACRAEKAELLPWGSDNFAPPEAKKIVSLRRNNLPEDLFALGVFLFVIIEGKLPESTRQAGSQIRRNVPRRIKNVITELLHANPSCRPRAEVVASMFTELSIRN